MRKYISLFFSALVFLCSCGDSSEKGVIDEEHMVTLLTDIHLTDASMNTIVGTPDSMYKYGTGRFKLVFDNHHTDSGAFVKSLKYYTSKPEKLVAIYDGVNAVLTKKTDSLNKIYQKQVEQEQKKLNAKSAKTNNNKADSIRKAMANKAAADSIRKEMVKNAKKTKLPAIAEIMKAKRDSINERKKQIESKKLKNKKPAKSEL